MAMHRHGDWRKEECGQVPMPFLYAATVTGEPIHYTLYVLHFTKSSMRGGSPTNHSISCDFLTHRLTFFLKSSLLSLHSFCNTISYRSQQIQQQVKTKNKVFFRPSKAFRLVKILQMVMWNPQNKNDCRIIYNTCYRLQ